MRPTFARKNAWLWQWHVLNLPPELVRVRQRFSFPIGSRGKCTCVLCSCKSCETYTCNPRILEGEKVRAGRRTTFGTGFAIPSVIVLSASRSWASAALSRESRDHGVVGTLSIPQGVRGSNHSHGSVLWFPALTASRMVGCRLIKNIARKRSLSGLTP
jgi:hypothetical protein